MKLELLKNEERQMNLIMFLAWGFLIPIAAFAFVMLFLDGTVKDAVVLLMVVFAILIKKVWVLRQSIYMPVLCRLWEL